MEREPRYEFKAWQHGGVEVSMSLPADVDMEEVLDFFKQWLLAVGYSSELVDEIQLVPKGDS